MTEIACGRHRRPPKWTTLGDGAQRAKLTGPRRRNAASAELCFLCVRLGKKSQLKERRRKSATFFEPVAAPAAFLRRLPVFRPAHGKISQVQDETGVSKPMFTHMRALFYSPNDFLPSSNSFESAIACQWSAQINSWPIARTPHGAQQQPDLAAQEILSASLTGSLARPHRWQQHFAT